MGFITNNAMVIIVIISFLCDLKWRSLVGFHLHIAHTDLVYGLLHLQADIYSAIMLK